MARRCAATSYPRSCNAERSDWRRLRKRKSVWRRRNAQPMTHAGRKPGQERNPKGGGQPYKRAYGEPDPKAQSNFTDPESRIMKTSTEGFQQCYNAQLAVDGEHQIIVATDVGAQAADQGQMMPLLDEVQHRFGAEPEVVLADAGYCNEADLVELEERGIDGHVALGREGKTQAALDPHHETRDAPHEREACGPARARAIRQAQVVIGGAERLDQGGARVQTVQPSGPGQGTG